MNHEPPSSNDKTAAAAAPSSTPITTTNPMFELTGLHGRITLDNVYLNGLHALRKLNIQNLSDQPILVKMRSNLRNQIAFQLENENISSLPESTLQSIVTTNTVSWSREAAEQYPFNQLFNYINHIDQIDLEPGQTRSFILAFLPETDNDARPQQQQNEDDFDMSVVASTTTTHDDDTETYSMFNVTGSLFFFGYYSTAKSLTTDNSDNATAKDVLSTSSLADYQVSVKFRASVCQSALWTDAAETGLNFDDCVLGETYYKDFTIQNRSEIDLYWLLNTMDLVSNNDRDWLQFIDADTGDALKSDEPISSFSSKQVRMLFWPKEVGEYNYDLQVENANDARNVVQTKVHATVRSVLRKETLIVSSGHVVDFGDCISGAWAVQQIVLNNVSESPVEVRFLPEGAEVIFDIKQDTTVVEPSETAAGSATYTDNTRMNSMRRKYSSHSAASRTNTGGINTPATGISELSGPNSELSSRSSSPTPIRTTTADNEGSFSPALTESPGSSRIHFPSHATIPEDSDSDAGGLMSVDGSIFTDTSTFNESSTVMSTTTASNVSSSNAPATLSTTESYTRIEDFVLKPGTERVIQVSYRPQKDASITDFNAGQLIRRQFRILLEYGTFRTEEAKEKKVIQCRARTCTSFVEAIPKVINFGDTDVGTLKSLPINIFNRSDILARVELQFSSKVLNCLRGEITIQPRSYVELKLDLYPRKVNPDYRKQITLVNFLNKDNDQIIEVHSTNIDKNRVTFHSLFYRILTATGANFLDFGSIALNSPSLRTFTVENIRDKPLQLEITTSLPEDIAIYTRNKQKVSESALPSAASASSATIATSAIASSAALNAASAMTNTSNTTKLSNSITAEAIEKGDVLADIPATSLTPALSSRRRSKLLLESISNRRIAKHTSSSSANTKDTAKAKKPTSESEATNKRRTSDAKKDLMAARRMRYSVQQLKMDQAHSSTAYLDLALPPLHSLKSYRRKMIQVNSDTSFLKNHHRKGLHSRLLQIPEEKDCVGNKDLCSAKDAVQSNKSQHHPRQMATKKSSSSGTGTGAGTGAASGSKHNTKHGSKEDMSLTTGGRHHLRVSTLNKTNSSSNSNSTATASPSAVHKNASRLSNHTRHSNYGTRNAKTKRSLGITAARYKSRKNLDWSDIAGKSRVPFEDLISVLEHGSKASPPLFPKQSAEEQFVRYQLAWRRELDRLVEKGVLVRTSLVDVDPKGEEEVVIVITPCGATKPHIQSAPKKQDARIFLRLVQFDRDIEQTEFENLLDTTQTDIPVREVILRSQLCRSVMDLGQKNINFGLVERNERHAKTIVLHNRSETPLLYAIRKSGSIASGDIDLDVGRYGVVRSYGKREVEFVFEPTLSGPFMEKLVIENIRDRTNDQVLLLKAQVRKPSTFLIKSLEMSFGHCLVDQPCQRTETIVLTNTNKQSRMFEVRVDPNEVIFGRYYGEFEFDVKEDDTNTISKEAEEEIENLEQKLKIAKRKAQPDKVKKYLRKLAKLKHLDHDDKEDSDSGKDKDKDEKSTKSSKSSSKARSDALDATADSTTNAVVSVAAAATSSIKESNIVFKKTAESVVFPLDAHASKTVSVTFKPVLRPFQTAEDAQDDNRKPEEAISVKGRILVHEYKNTDVCKSIVYTAEVYTDEAAYIDALALENDGENTGAASTRADTAAMAAAANDASQADKPGAVATTTAATTRTGLDANQSETTEQKETEPEAIQLERHFFDGGRVELNQEAVFYVKVTNTSQQPIGFALSTAQVPSVFDFDAGGEASKELLPGETRKIRYGIKPTQVGRQQYTFSVRNKRTGSLQPFTIECLVHCSTYLDFPSLADEANGVLDLGFSYVDPGSKYSQVTPLLVENKSGQDVFITCQSNLSHQVLIFMDEAGERGLVEMMPLKCGSMTTVWVAVQPNLLTGYLGNSADECRELVGGIKFSVYEKDQQQQPSDQGQDMLLMLTQTVKFISIIGQSHLEVSDKVINLGYTDLLQKEFYGAFTIKNKSGELPLDYEVECSSGNIELDRRGGTLHGWRGTKVRRDTDMSYLDSSSHDDDQKKRKGSLASLHANDSSSSIDGMRRGSYDDFSSVPASLTQITFRINAYRYGLLNEKLTVTNKRNSQEVFVIDVRLFVDCKKLDAWAVPSKKLLLQSSSGHHQNGYDDYDQTDHREADPLPLIKWESIYISPVTTAAAQQEETVLQIMELPEADAHRLYVRELDVANTSGQPMQLVVMSDVDITAGFAVDEDKVKTVALQEHKDNLFIQRSGQFSLQPGQRIRVRLHNPSAEKLDEDGRALALQGQNGSLKGMMVLYDARQQIEVLALELEALFCVSHTELVMDRIDLGKIGHSTSFKPARFEFQISNLADVPATYDIKAPSYINFTPLDRNGVAVKQKMFYIPSRKTQRIEGLLMPKDMPDQTSGLHRFDVRIDNLRNHANTMHLHLKALMTVFELRFERLSSNGELVLPTLHHPIALQNAPCDNWFVIHNKTDEDLRFEIGADITPELSPYVHLDVLSRYTNSPLLGDIAIGPQGSIEVRVRASPNEASRLPRNRPEFTDSAGVIMAKLWVTTRPAEEEEEEEEEEDHEQRSAAGNTPRTSRMREMIPVRCALDETATFALSERRLDFKLVTYYQDSENGESSDIMDSACMPENLPLTIINHAIKVPLRFKVTVEGPAEFPAHEMVMISGLNQDRTGMVAPGGTTTLQIAISNPKESMPGQLKIHVDDLDALGESRQTVSMYVTEIVWDL
ncbi:hypothetical protein MAM1_0054c03542 [Mucor ambiguus]|uniref:Uncharacterized protein n=1 Tax=Mucor ambiguus TaxID=91626 RepID=A0A0C9MPY9_9FUNG|nr:hypothetical protein MAM1_0054c03542 [Mucor ambiguus]